jgi:predicted  nucleic acid-binding Zn-ribbon protein
MSPAEIRSIRTDFEILRQAREAAKKIGEGLHMALEGMRALDSAAEYTEARIDARLKNLEASLATGQGGG